MRPKGHCGTKYFETIRECPPATVRAKANDASPATIKCQPKSRLAQDPEKFKVPRGAL